jgi:hypothetical protein
VAVRDESDVDKDKARNSRAVLYDVATVAEVLGGALRLKQLRAVRPRGGLGEEDVERLAAGALPLSKLVVRRDRERRPIAGNGSWSVLWRRDTLTLDSAVRWVDPLRPIPCMRVGRVVSALNDCLEPPGLGVEPLRYGGAGCQSRRFR